MVEAVKPLSIPQFWPPNSLDYRSELIHPANVGGLGLVNLNNFLISQHCQWFKRVSFSTRDNWRVDLLNLCYGNVYTPSPGSINKKEHPILHLFACSMEKFSFAFTSHGSNYKLAFLLNNPSFKRSKDDPEYLDENFFGIPQGANAFRFSYSSTKIFGLSCR